MGVLEMAGSALHVDPRESVPLPESDPLAALDVEVSATPARVYHTERLSGSIARVVDQFRDVSLADAWLAEDQNVCKTLDLVRVVDLLEHLKDARAGPDHMAIRIDLRAVQPLRLTTLAAEW